MPENEKNLQTIAQEKIKVPDPAPVVVKEVKKERAYPNQPSNYVMNIIAQIKDSQGPTRVWFDFDLPSNGRCGYPKTIQLRELTTDDEKTLLKEIFGSRQNSTINLLKKCAKFETLPDFDFEDLTTFDQDFILLELSAITFPGEKEIIITDDNGHKIEMKLNKDELELEKMEEKTEYPVFVLLENVGLTWFFEFMTVKKLKQIEKAQKGVPDEILSRTFVSMAHSTSKVLIKETNEEMQIDTWMDYVRLLESLKPSDLKKLIEFYNENTSLKYGYKLTKNYFCPQCSKDGIVELDPINFFRLTI